MKEDFLWDDLILSKKTINEAMSVALSRLQPSRLMLTSCKTTAQMLQDLLSNLKACKVNIPIEDNYNTKIHSVLSCNDH